MRAVVANGSGMAVTKGHGTVFGWFAVGAPAPSGCGVFLGGCVCVEASGGEAHWDGPVKGMRGTQCKLLYVGNYLNPSVGPFVVPLFHKTVFFASCALRMWQISIATYFHTA